ncbi:conjugal transfer protein [Listeria ilorinensis]|uniref:conjugal transfer protein n=1 Tax=Listeria ilorinensis TaxID=2867439 RepID=UPI001EF3FC07|nr:conjugal transfer protein [Listeria ilorinensis]
MKKKKTQPLQISRSKYRKIFLVVGWSLLIGSVIFGIYNNFTAIDTNTVTEKEIIEEKNKDVSGVEMFVNRFVNIYFSYDVTPESKETRKKQLEDYLQDNLLQVNSDTVEQVKEKTDTKNVEIWQVKDVTKKGTKGADYEVSFSVTQYLTNSKKNVQTSYTVGVHEDSNGYVVTKNPTVTDNPKKSTYEKPETVNKGDMVTSKEMDQIRTFLDTFYKLYPSASDKEIVYYVKDKDVKAINKNYQFMSINNLVVNKTKKGYQADFICKYKDNDTGMIINNEYEVKLEKQGSGELIITEME